MKITTLHTLDTEYSADCIEWCPNPEYNDLFVCGTYQLEGDNTNSSSPPCRRKGRLYLYQFNKDNKELMEKQRLETAAILDMKWLLKSEDKPVLAIANAMGQVEVYELIESKLLIRAAINLNLECHNLLTLSLDWNWQTNNENHSIVASDSRGDISYIEYTKDGGLEIKHSWSAHNFESWICCFDKWNPHQVYSGGDDTFLHVFDIRNFERVLTNRSHIAGVTSLQSYPNREHILLTGSYDERLRIFDTRAFTNPLGEINLNGGIWRIKSDPLNRNLILVACMYHNFSIVKLSDLSSLSLVGEYNEHESICYGADWCLNSKNYDHEMYMATCSFYDHKLCLSSIIEN